MKKIALILCCIVPLCCALGKAAAQTATVTDITVVYKSAGHASDLFNDVSKFFFDSGNLVIDQQGQLSYITLADIRKLTLDARAVGIETYEANPDILIYPNPASDRLFFASESEQEVSVTVFAMNGQILLKQQMSTSESLDVSSLSKGMYVIRVNENAFKFSKL